MLVAINTHPVQYHAPVFRHLQQVLGIPVTAVYGSDFSVAGYADREFGAAFAWDVDLLSGYRAEFLGRVREGGAASFEEVTAAGMEAVLHRLRPSVVLSMGYRPKFHVDGFRIARRMKVPILLRAETTDHAVARHWLKRSLRDLLLRRHYASCAAVLPIGQRSRAHYARLGVPERKMFFSPYCVDTTSFEASEAAREHWRDPVRTEIGASADTIVLGYFGKLSARKAPGLILDAVRSLPVELRSRCMVLVVGDGELRQSLVQTAAAEPAIPLRDVGFQNQRALSRWYHACDMVVMPSLHGETWGLVVNEALHHGVPAIVSEAVGCGPDLVEPGRTGEVAETGSAGSLAEAIQRLVRYSSAGDTRAACRTRMESYTVAAAAEGIARAYQEVLP